VTFAALLGFGSYFQHEMRCCKSKFYFSIFDGDGDSCLRDVWGQGRGGDGYDV